MFHIYEVTSVKVTKNPKYARVCGYDISSGLCFNELYGKNDVKPIAVGDKVTLGYKKYDGKYMTFVNKYEVKN